MFEAVALSLNFRQAAEQLHMSQPPLSRAIKLLEQRLGVQLFERNTQGVALTRAGADLLPKAQQILGLLDEAENSLMRQQGMARFRLGLTTSVDAGLFSGLTRSLENALGQTSLELTFASSPRLISAIRTGKLDAAVIAMPSKTYELKVQSLVQQDMMVALQSRHPLARRRSLSLADLNAETVYWFERARQPAFFDHCHAIFRSHAFAPRFLREPLDHHVLLNDVASGKGIAFLPESFASLKLSGVAYRKLAEGKELSVGLGIVTQPSPHPLSKVLEELASSHLQ
ncbi:LysR family transcriptional regulator [Undibacterium terreum]|uniref:LysR family transcriptional regulator n=2 Tax=Undibacterium terreum TaxID=1224302 RepID=A0A916V0I7_9BURK|nr:LysR family transcriptional regulator [Undibacterium terreum]